VVEKCTKKQENFRNAKTLKNEAKSAPLCCAKPCLSNQVTKDLTKKQHQPKSKCFVRQASSCVALSDASPCNRKGKERKGKERKGKERKGKERKKKTKKKKKKRQDETRKEKKKEKKRKGTTPLHMRKCYLSSTKGNIFALTERERMLNLKQN